MQFINFVRNRNIFLIKGIGINYLTLNFLNLQTKTVQMTFLEFKQSLEITAPPKGISEILVALWHDAKGDWESAHNIAQTQEGVQSYDRLHAYLHRKEADNWNANYWYRRANTAMPDINLEEEWLYLVDKELLK